jgi:hypothetical protein
MLFEEDTHRKQAKKIQVIEKDNKNVRINNHFTRTVAVLCGFDCYGAYQYRILHVAPNKLLDLLFGISHVYMWI